MVNVGMAAIGATTGTGTITTTATMLSLSAASVFRSGVGGVTRPTMVITRTVIIPTVIRTDTAAATTGATITTTETDTATTTVPATGAITTRKLPSSNAAWRTPDIIGERSTESLVRALNTR